MGAFLPKPMTNIQSDSGAKNGLSWTMGAMQGWRVDMEDAHICEIGLSEKLADISLFAVFDGHAGKYVAEESAKSFVADLLEQKPFNTMTSDDYNIDDVKQGLSDAFRHWDKILRTKCHEKQDRSGCTATGVMVTPKHFFFFNIGDSRTLLVRNREINFASDDHKPTNDDEKKRIESAGGRVMMQRINGSLAVSRALGDFDYKTRQELPDNEQLVSPEPDVTVVDRDVDNDNYLVVACDGIFDVMSNEEIEKYCSDRFTSVQNPKDVTNELIDLCLNKNSRDNMSAVIVSLAKVPKPVDSKIEAEMKLNDSILSELKEFFSQGDGPRSSIDTVMGYFESKDFIKSAADIGGVPILLAKCGYISRAFDIISKRKDEHNA